MDCDEGRRRDLVTALAPAEVRWRERLHGRIVDVDAHLMLGPDEYRALLGQHLGASMIRWSRQLVAGVTDEVRTQAATLAAADPWMVRGFLAHGALDPTDRLDALERMGIDRQLVLPGASLPTLLRKGGEARRTIRRYNDFMLDWRPAPRLVPAGQLPLHDVGDALADADRLVRQGFSATEVPFAEPPAGVSPAMADWDPLWSRLAGAGVTVVLHTGGGGVGSAVPPARCWVPTGWFGGERLELPLPPFLADTVCRETSGPVALATLHHPAELFLTALVLGGVFDRHPGLRVLVLETGSDWVGPWVERLDRTAHGYRSFGLDPLERLPSEVVRSSLRVAPFEGEDVATAIGRYGLESTFAFASDYPHAEGGKDPVGRLLGNLAPLGDEAVIGFFGANAGPLLR